ncbi:MAG: aminopeptidase P family protein [Chlamydiae bacterium]|nr:aminopeptidase P family protein [Chlamydiota bacterium]
MNLSKRIEEIKKRLQLEDFDGYLTEDSVELFYLTGLIVSTGCFIILKNKEILFLDGRYIAAAKEKTSHPILSLTDENKHAFLAQNKVEKIVFNGTRMNHERYLSMGKMVKPIGTKLFSQPRILQSLRSIKDDFEIKSLQKSAGVLQKAYRYTTKFFRSGITERELAWKFEVFARQNGAEKLSFEPIIAFGKNSAYPHHRSSSSKLKKGDLILIDLGVVVDHYCSDMTRIHFYGSKDPVLWKMYQTVRSAQKAALKLCRPGTSLEELDLAARREMAKEGMEELFSHSLGHGVGIEIHEFPRISKDGVDKEVILERGMVITIEPGLYLPGKGGVRYEDTIVITKDGYKNFYPPSIQT